MIGKCIHTSKFGYFYTYCLINNNEKIKREISKLQCLVEKTNNLDARNNIIYNKKLTRKENRVEKVLKRIAVKEPSFLINFIEEYSNELDSATKETDPMIISRNLSQSFYDIYKITSSRKNNIVTKKNNYQYKEQDIVINLTNKEKNHLDKKEKNNKEFSAFLSELKKCKCDNLNRQLNVLNEIIQIEVYKKESKKAYEKRINKVLRYANHNIDMIFKKGNNYPFRKKFIKVLSTIVYLYDIKEKKPTKLKERLKESLRIELLNKYNNSEENKKISNYGYEIPNDTNIETIVKVNEELEKEKYDLIERYKRGERIKFDRIFSNNIRCKKIDMINSYFNKRYNFELNEESSEEEFVKVVLDLCELADEITDDLFKKVLFDAHDSSNLSITQSYEKTETLRTIYNLYNPIEKLDNYINAKTRFEKIFMLLNSSKRDNIYKLVYEEKQKKHLSITELLPSRETIMNNLEIRETKFIESHAVEEFKYKAMNSGKYLNYDLEIVARDINVDSLPNLYQKLKRNITYTNFVEEIKPGEDRERKYKEARITQRKTLAVAQEMVAKTILNKSYERKYDISYDNYQSILNNIYENILHEERLNTTYDEVYDEAEVIERNYQEKKKIWDEHSIFVKALYLVVSKKGNK